MRLFIAVNLPDNVQAALAHTQKDLQRELVSPALRWTRPENTHLTLLFLGEIAEGHVAKVAEKLRAACEDFNSFELEISGVGCFPNMRRPRVLWLGLSGDLDSLQAVNAQVMKHCGAFAERRDDKPFHPHLTLARIKFEDKSVARDLNKTLSKLRIDAARWRVESVELMRSELLPSGAEYSIMESAALLSPPFSR